MVVDSDFSFGVPTARSKSNARVFQKCLDVRISLVNIIRKQLCEMSYGRSIS